MNIQFKTDNMQSQQQSITAGLQAALQHQALIRGAIKRAGIKYGCQDYEDFLQEAYLAFAQAYHHFPGDPEKDEQFLVYAYQNVNWRMTDLLRYEQRRKHEELAVNNKQEINADPNETAITQLILTQLLKDSSPVDGLIIKEHFLNDCPLSQIAKDYQCSPRTLRAHRAKLRERFSTYLEIITDGDD